MAAAIGLSTAEAVSLGVGLVGTGVSVASMEQQGRMQDALSRTEQAESEITAFGELQRTLAAQRSVYGAYGVNESSGTFQAAQEQTHSAGLKQLQSLRSKYGIKRDWSQQQTQGAQLGTLFDFVGRSATKYDW